jgi:hypothetical protein
MCQRVETREKVGFRRVDTREKVGFRGLTPGRRWVSEAVNGEKVGFMCQRVETREKVCA